jgi:hypothetical protein
MDRIMALPKQRIAVRPESEPKISGLVRKLLREADAAGVLPTPLGRLFEVARVTNIEELPDENFLQMLSERTRGFFRSARQKLRGIADLRERATYVPRDLNTGRERFAQAHELGHQVMSWHDVDPTYLDDDESLGPSAKGIFEHEANFFGAETIFQGAHFRMLARDYQPSFNAIFTLAHQHGASRQSTAWRFVEEQDEALALLQYYPANAIDQDGNCVLAVWRSVGSPHFNRRYMDIDLPQVIRTGHPWVAARDFDRPCQGTENLLVGGNPVAFQWHAWWNSHALLVLLRRKPVLSVVGG